MVVNVCLFCACSEKKPLFNNLSGFKVVASGKTSGTDGPSTTSALLKSPVPVTSPQPTESPLSSPLATPPAKPLQPAAPSTPTRCICPDGPFEQDKQHTYIWCKLFVNCYACLQYAIEGKAHRKHGDPQPHKRICSSKQGSKRAKKKKRVTPKTKGKAEQPSTSVRNLPLSFERDPPAKTTLSPHESLGKPQALSSPLPRQTTLVDTSLNIDLLGDPFSGTGAMLNFPGSPLPSGTNYDLDDFWVGAQQEPLGDDFL